MADTTTLSVFVPDFRPLPHNWKEIQGDIWATVQRGEEEQAYRERGWTVCSFGPEPGTIRLRIAYPKAMAELRYMRQIKKQQLPRGASLADDQVRYRVTLPEGDVYDFTD